MKAWWVMAVLAACTPKGEPMNVVDLPPMPTAAATAAWSPPAPTKLETTSGAPVYLHEQHGLPLVSVRLQIPVGSAHDPRDKWGLAALTAEMLEESSGELSSLERAAALDRLAARFSIDAGRDYLTVGLDVQTEHLATAMALLADAVLRPSFAASDWERVHQRHTTSIEQGLDDNAMVASAVSSRVLFGDEHPYGHPIQGTLASARAVTLEDVRAFWAEHGHAGGIAFVVVGDVAPDQALALLEQSFADWGARARTARELPAPAGQAGRWFVDSPGSTQTVVRTVAVGPPGSVEDRWPTELARLLIGGSFTSRLNQKLREEKGYTYGARLGIPQWGAAGMVTASSSVQADATAPAVVDLMAVLASAREQGFTEAEVTRARAQATLDLVDSAESRSRLAGLYTHEIEVGRDPLAVSGFGARIQQVEAADLQAAAERWIDPANAGILLVGDKEKVMPELEAAGLTGWVFLDEHGDPI